MKLLSKRDLEKGTHDIVLSSSSVEMLQQCPMKYFARFVRQVGAESEEREWAPLLGVKFHAMMRDWCRSGALSGAWINDVEEGKQRDEAQLLVERAAWWTASTSKPWTRIVAVEEAGFIQLATLAVKGERWRVIVRVKPDVIVEDATGALWTLDWKTKSTRVNREIWLKTLESSMASHLYALYGRLRYPEKRYKGAVFVGFEKAARHQVAKGESCNCCEPALKGYVTRSAGETVTVDHVDLTDYGVQRSVDLMLEAARKHRRMVMWCRENMLALTMPPFTPPSEVAAQHSWNCSGKFGARMCYLRGSCDGLVDLENRLYYSKIDPFAYYEEDEVVEA